MSLKVGIVGCGGISRYHASAYSCLSSVDFTAICDINQEALDKRADEHGVSNRYTDYEEMFASANLDLVSVCTHAPLHAPVTIAAARAGINVLCEKPLSVDLETADTMIAACAEAEVELAVSHQYRFSPLYRLVREWIEEGRIGQFRSIREVGKGRAAGFELMEMGVHYFDEMDFFARGVEWVHAQMTYEGHEVGVEDIVHSSELCTTDRRDNGMVAGDTMLVHLGGPNGVSGVVELYRREELNGYLHSPHLLGTMGQIKIERWEMWYCPSDAFFVEGGAAWECVEIDPAAFVIGGETWGSGHPIWSVKHMVESLQAGETPELGGPNAITSIQCVSAAYESHFTKARAYLPLEDRRHPLIKRMGSAA